MGPLVQNIYYSYRSLAFFILFILIFVASFPAPTDGISQQQRARAEALKRQMMHQGGAPYRQGQQSYIRRLNPAWKGEGGGEPLLNDEEHNYIDEEYYASRQPVRRAFGRRGRNPRGMQRRDAFDPNCTATCTSLVESTFFVLFTYPSPSGHDNIVLYTNTNT